VILGKIFRDSSNSNDLVKSFELEESSKGPDSFFSPRGKHGLMFLKNYSQVSDKKLIEQRKPTVNPILKGNICPLIFVKNNTTNAKKRFGITKEDVFIG
jgi:hypothetical protein